MKPKIWIVMAFCAIWTGQAMAGGNVNFQLGQKKLNSGDWGSSFDEQAELGLLFDIGGENWPVSLAVDLLVSEHDDSNTIIYSSPTSWVEQNMDGTASTAELDVGVRKVFELSRNDLHPYLGGGLGIISANYSEDGSYSFYDNTYGYLGTSPYSKSDNDASIGYWLNAGIYWSIGGHFNLGVDARYSKAKVTLFTQDVQAGGSHIGVIAGYHW